MKLTVTVFGLTKAMQASLMTSQAKIETAGGRPLILQADDVVVVAADVVLDKDVVEDDVVDAFGVVDGAAGVVEMARVVDGAAGVVDGAAGVVDGARGVVEGAAGVVDGAAGVVEPYCLFFFFEGYVQAAVTVTCVLAAVPVWVTVAVASLIGTKDEQKAEAFSATSTALHA